MEGRKEEKKKETRRCLLNKKEKNDVAYGNDVGLGHGSNDTKRGKSRLEVTCPRRPAKLGHLSCKWINLQWCSSILHSSLRRTFDWDYFEEGGARRTGTIDRLLGGRPDPTPVTIAFQRHSLNSIDQHLHLGAKA